jgi:hypothetical protein
VLSVGDGIARVYGLRSEGRGPPPRCRAGAAAVVRLSVRGAAWIAGFPEAASSRVARQGLDPRRPAARRMHPATCAPPGASRPASWCALTAA